MDINNPEMIKQDEDWELAVIKLLTETENLFNDFFECNKKISELTKKNGSDDAILAYIAAAAQVSVTILVHVKLAYLNIVTFEHNISKHHQCAEDPCVFKELIEICAMEKERFESFFHTLQERPIKS